MDSAACQSVLAFEIKRAEPSLRADSSSVLRPDASTMQEAGGPAAERREAPPAVGLPCLNSNNSDGDPKKSGLLQGMARKVAFALTENINNLAREYGVERLGFLTFTFPDHVTDPKECNRRFGNLRRRTLSRYEKWIAVRERQASGRLHLHLLVVTKGDIKTGVNFQEIKAKNYRSAGECLRSEWAFWRRSAKKYGFGRTELMPIKTNAEGISRYAGKYIQKNLDHRIPADKGARLVSYSKGTGKVKANGFAWNSPRAYLWRKKLSQVAHKCGISNTQEFKHKFGSRWAWTIQKRVVSEKLTFYPTAAIARCDEFYIPEGAVDISIEPGWKSDGYWMEHMQDWVVEMQKLFAFNALKIEREFFTPESEAEFKRRVDQSLMEATKYPEAVPEYPISEFDDVVATYPRHKINNWLEANPF